MLYTTDFSSPTFDPGVGNWADNGGWFANDDSDSEGIGTISGTNQNAYLGKNATLNPADGSTFVEHDFNYDPTRPGRDVVQISTRMAVFDSTTGPRDTFSLQLYNSDVDLLASIVFNNADKTIKRGDGDGPNIATNVTFKRGSYFNLTIEINYRTNTWSAMMDSSTLFSNVQYNHSGVFMDLGETDFVWDSTGTTTGNNYLSLDNFSLAAVPEPGAPSLLASGAALFLLGLRRRRFHLSPTLT